MGPYIEILYIYIGGVLYMEAAMFLVVAQTGQTKHTLSFYDNWRLPQVLFHVWKGRVRWGVFSCNMQLHHFMSLNSTHCNFKSEVRVKW